jgi:hypothetical protein
LYTTCHAFNVMSGGRGRPQTVFDELSLALKLRRVIYPAAGYFVDVASTTLQHGPGYSMYQVRYSAIHGVIIGILNL